MSRVRHQDVQNRKGLRTFFFQIGGHVRLGIACHEYPAFFFAITHSGQMLVEMDKPPQSVGVIRDLYYLMEAENSVSL